MAPQKTRTGNEPITAPKRGAAGRQVSPSYFAFRQLADRAKNETISTTDAAQANSQAGIGMSSPAERACARGTSIRGG
jgi:hypothetical protein